MNGELLLLCSLSLTLISTFRIFLTINLYNMQFSLSTSIPNEERILFIDKKNPTKRVIRCQLIIFYYFFLISTKKCKFRMMTKHAQNRKRFGRRNFKQRYFRLTTHTLSYAKAKGKRPICDIPLTELVAVERLEEKSFKLQNIFRVSLNFLVY